MSILAVLFAVLVQEPTFEDWLRAGRAHSDCVDQRVVALERSGEPAQTVAEAAFDACKAEWDDLWRIRNLLNGGTSEVEQANARAAAIDKVALERRLRSRVVEIRADRAN